MLEVPVATLRTWEDRYAEVVPTRNASGRRLYSRRQVEQLQFVRARMKEGVSVADAHRLLAEQAEAWPPATEPPPPSPPASRPLIQLAESHPYAAELEEYFLAAQGYQVEVTLTEAAARTAFEAARPAVVIVDVLISGGAGLELCRHFRERDGVAIVVVSAVEAGQAAIDAGADVFLRKPLDPVALVTAVRDLLGSAAALAR
jgi:DNA-binding transcriptional MerR regulator